MQAAPAADGRPNKLALCLELLTRITPMAPLHPVQCHKSVSIHSGGLGDTAELCKHNFLKLEKLLDGRIMLCETPSQA